MRSISRPYRKKSESARQRDSHYRRGRTSGAQWGAGKPLHLWCGCGVLDRAAAFFEEPFSGLHISAMEENA